MALARLRTRWSNEGTHVHPADLDDTLCASAAMGTSQGGTGSGGTGSGGTGSGDEPRLPFAVDAALMRAAVGDLWAVSLCTSMCMCMCDVQF